MSRLIYKLAVWVLCLVVGVGVFSTSISVIRGADIEGVTIEAFIADLEFLKTKTEAVLYFVPFGNNYDEKFRKYRLSDAQVQQICGVNCGGHIGANFGTFFKGGDYAKARQFGMTYASEILENNTGSINNAIGVINQEGVANIVIRIGITEGSGGFDNPAQYVAALRRIAEGVGGKTFYAIAGPNEPDIEAWYGNCGGYSGEWDTARKQQYFSCAGQALASYMNVLVDAGLPSNVRLLSPAFNMTSSSFNEEAGGIPEAMRSAGAKFDSLYGYAGNLYPAGKTMQQYWVDQEVDRIFAGKPIIITETAFEANGFNEDDIPEENWYIHPIKGINDETDPNARDLSHVIRDELIRQGYEAYCATPGFEISMTKYGDEWMNHFLDEANRELWRFSGDGTHGLILGSQDHFFASIANLGRPLNGDMESNYPIFSRLTIDYKDARMPIFRDMVGKQWLTSSLEQFFGFKDSQSASQQGYSEAELNSSAMNSLLSNTQRCTQVFYNLQAQDAMCQKLANPSTCALYNRDIPNTSYSVKQLLEEFSGYAGNNVLEACGKLMSSPDVELAPQDVTMKQAIEVMPLHIDRLYRLAFLVTTIQLRGASTVTMFNFFAKPTVGGLPATVPQPRHEVLITAFKIPDFVTNKGEITSKSGASSPAVGETANVPFADPNTLTRNSLIRKKEAEALDVVGQLKRETLFMTAFDTFDPEGASPREQSRDLDEIHCAEGQDGSVYGTTGVNSPACKDPLGKALVDIINAQRLIVEDPARYGGANAPEYATDYKFADLTRCRPNNTMISEEATKITDRTSLHELDDPGHVFTAEHGGAILANLMGIVTNYRGDNSCGITDEFDPNYSATQADHKGACPQIAPANWGLKTFFHVVPSMMEAEWPLPSNRNIPVKHFLVYPKGYDLRMLETVMSGTFFTTGQLTELNEEVKKHDRIEITRDIIAFDGGTRDYRYRDGINRNDPSQPAYHGDFLYDSPLRYETVTVGGESRRFPVFECGTRGSGKVVGDFDPITDRFFRTVEWTEPRAEKCTRVFGMNIGLATPINHAKVLGAKLGYWVRTVQKSFHTIDSIPRTYLDLCSTTEEYLTGACGQLPDPQLPGATGQITYPTLQNGVQGLPDSDVSACTNDGKHLLEVSASINDSDRTWKVRINCPSCQGVWGDLGVTVNNTFMGQNNLNLGSTLEYPCSTCNNQDLRVPQTTVKSTFCFNVSITSNPSGEQCSVNPFQKTICQEYGPTTTNLANIPTTTLEEMDYYGQTLLPATGRGTYYGAGVMNQVLRNHQGSGQISYGEISSCELFGATFETINKEGNNGYVGCVAMLRRGDVPMVDNPSARPRVIWIRKPSGAVGPDVVGPFLVIDVAAQHHAPQLYEDGWVVDIDRATWSRWFPGALWYPNNRPQQVTICDNANSC